MPALLIFLIGFALGQSWRLVPREGEKSNNNNNNNSVNKEAQ